MRPYPFPWPLVRFFGTFPECVYLDPPPIAPIPVDSKESYDLVIIAYQAWFLSPSLPVTAFLKSEAAPRLIKGKPVITLIGCRNMWAMAHEQMKVLLAHAGARLIDNVVLTDRGGLSTFVTTPLWMLTGRKDSLWGMPPPGITAADIEACDRFGRVLVTGLAADMEREDGPMLDGLHAVEADPRLISMERAGHRSFRVWGRLLRALGAPGSRLRAGAAVLFAIYLTLIILIAMPIIMAIQTILKPLFAGRMAVDKAYFEAPSGSADHRMRSQAIIPVA